MQINEVKYGFKLISITDLTDLDSKLYQYYHEKSGATVVYVENDDTNCCFTIGFRTLPQDSTGVCHIIEHSLLCGSEKYPLKEPFVNLMKTSMATFLNAFTANDWTMYPFASQVEQDFNNILSIYCDAVFRPLSMKDPKPFLQEGWHLEMLSKDDIPSYKGVVYNEMKGAMSSVDRILQQATLEAMYKDSFYGYNSGGDPDVIPSLTYEDYKAFYHKHYTPQNAMTYFYGKMDIEAKLKWLDEEYFSHYTKTDEEIIIKEQEPFISRDFVKEYELGEGESEKDNTYMSLCYGLGYYDDYEEFIAMQVLLDALLSKNDSPLKKALLDAKLGVDVDAFIDDDKIKPSLNIILSKTNKNKKDEFFNVFTAKVQELVKNGIPKELLKASINYFEFKDKELDTGGFPKGLVIAMNMMGNFNYHFSLDSHLFYSKHYNKLRNELDNGYFERLLEKYLLNNNHMVQVMCVPSLTLGKERKEKMDALMKSIKDNMSEEEIDATIKQTQELLAYQNKIDTKEELDLLPKLSVKDIPSSINWLDTKKTKVKGIPSFYHEVSTNKIAYLRAYFSLDVLPFSDLPYVKLLLRLFTNLPTSTYSVEELSNKIKMYLGDFSFSMSIGSVSKEKTIEKVKLSISSLEENVDQIAPLMNEVLLHTKFNAKEIKRVLNQMLTDARIGIMQNGTGVAITKARASFSKEGALLSKVSGIELYYFISDLLNNFDGKAICNKLKDICKLLFTKANATFSLSGDKETIASLKEKLKKVKLPNKEVKQKLEVSLLNASSQAFVIPSDVSYNALVSSINDFDVTLSGKLYILSHIVSLDYLWPEVRVKGGSYGASMRVTRSGDIFFSSFRDPNVKNTYEAYENIANYLKKLKPSKEEFFSYVIGAVGSFDQPTSTSSLIDSMDSNYLLGIGKKDLMQIKKEMLHTTLKDVRGYASLMESIASKCSRCSVGNATKINEYGKFDEVKPL